MPSPLEPITASGLDPMAALQSTLTQMQQLQQQPVIGNDPYGKVGAVLSGLGAGLQGRPNPAIQQGLQMQQQQMLALQQQADIATKMQTLGTQQWRLIHDMQKEARSNEDKRLDAIADFAKPLLQSSDPSSRTVGVNLTKHVLTSRRMPPETIAMVDRISDMPFDPGKTDEIMKASLMGVPDEYIARKYSIPVPVLQSMRMSLQNDDARKVLGLKSNTELQTEAVTLQNKVLEGIEKQFGIQAPYSKDVYAFATELFKKDLRDLKPEEWSQAISAWRAHDLQEAANRGGLQPVSGETLQRYLSLSNAVDNLRQIVADVNADPGKLKNYMGYRGIYGLKEWAEGRMGTLPPEAITLAFLEEQLRNITLQYRSGAAVTEHEQARILKELPVRDRDVIEVYRVRADWALRTMEVAKQRMEILAGPGGRAAMLQGNFAKFAAEVQMQHPLPPLPELKGTPKAKLPQGWTLPEGTR